MTLLDLGLEQADADEQSPGQWRLARIEVVNWGTFDGAHRIDVSRKGHLITGASGSGKSSLLDAIAAVLTPERWLRFNAAAQDASSRADDRGLVSYVRGAWTKEADELEDRAVSAYLRPRATWSGILLRFENQGDAPVTLVRLFHLPGSSTARAELKDAFVLLRSEVVLTDLAPFVAKGIEARRLKAAFPDGVVSTGSHGGFFTRMRRLFGIGSDNALHLLHKTQSAKNLGNLDTLFRAFMLDRPGTFDQARTATEQFRELNAAHVHVVELRRQAEHLERVEEAMVEYERQAQAVTELQHLIEVQEPFQDRMHLKLAQAQREEQTAQLARAAERAAAAGAARGEAESILNEARMREARLGGGDAGLMRRSIDDARREADRIRDHAERFASELRAAGIEHAPTDAAEFAALQESARADLAVAPEADDSHAVHERHADARRRVAELDEQLTALRNRRSNIEPRLIAVREWLAGELRVSEKSLPFGGELIDVLPEFAEWTGAIERVLRPLASALLVPDGDLVRVRRLIEKRSLGTRLVIEAVPREAAAPRPSTARDSLLHRIRVSDGPFQTWMQSRLSESFDLSCVAGPDDLDDVERGVTIGGQIKTSSRRYEKNDRVAIDNREHWVLGSDNQAKIDHLLDRRADAQRELDRARAVRDEHVAVGQAALTRRLLLQRVIERAWTEFDATAADQTIADREAELARLTAKSHDLADASHAVADAEEHKRVADREADAANAARALAESALNASDDLIQHLTGRLDGVTVSDDDSALLEARYRSVQRRIDTANIAEIGAKVVKVLNAAAQEADEARSRSMASFARLTVDFQRTWPTAAPNLTPEIEDRAGYRALLDGIRTRGLPTHEENFRRLLREKSRDLIGHLLSEIRDAPKQIEERIDPVNASLGRSLFDADRYLRIRVRTKRSPEAAEFMTELKGIVDGSWDQNDLRAEERFAALKRIMDRLESAENGERADYVWRQRCLDTREHVTFQAQEVDRAGRVLSVHDSSAGLSGGQRQKLVIFCLAAALRYQLTDDDQDIPTYGTIVLDEAFDKADSQYTRMAMDVFHEFGFHMILATPQKLLQTIESYVGAVTSVSNPTRRQSLLSNVPFEQVN
ncbi:AAA family ATPase [Microbacterium sp. YMB-B2]|uniref:AAA family ATPase n=1 Tax=Microbacterium tenebrionis TaxID=2830665 RepID=A0A9X1LLT8_9MICO|nr:ATP-binding protein [Microbacterium tenebrionis]MCC2028098.1 AAA family ATPase [Microbacterium tenebrionis]